MTLVRDPVVRAAVPVPAPTDADGEHSLGLHLQGAIAVLSLGAAAIHFAAMGEHSSISWQHSAFFGVVAWLEIAFGALIIFRPSRLVLAGGIAFNAGIVSVWAVSRTVGITFGGGTGIEQVGFADVLATVLEGLTIIGLLVLLRVGVQRRAWAGRGVKVTMAATGFVLLPLITAGFSPALAGADGHQHGSSSAGGHNHGILAGALTGKTACEKSGPPVSEGQVQGGHGHRGPTAQLPVDQATLLQLEQQQTSARQVVFRYPTVADAERAGYAESTVYVPCIGAHYTNAALAGSFNPAAPSELLYDGTTPTSRIVGLSYLVFHLGGPPAGFAGPNDFWHQHTFNGGLCLRGGIVIGAESTSNASCEAMGGTKARLDNIWMVHDWVVPGLECSWGVFAGECPELGGHVGGRAFAS